MPATAPPGTPTPAGLIDLGGREGGLRRGGRRLMSPRMLLGLGCARRMLGRGLTTCLRTGGFDTGRVAGRGRGLRWGAAGRFGGGVRFTTTPRRTGFLMEARRRTARRTGTRGERETVRLTGPRLIRIGRGRDLARTRGAARRIPPPIRRLPPRRFKYSTSCSARQGLPGARWCLRFILSIGPFWCGGCISFESCCTVQI
ncbi:MAG: hypothetical protein ACE5FI_07550 [Anaerolineales bacterium]